MVAGLSSLSIFFLGNNALAEEKEEKRDEIEIVNGALGFDFSLIRFEHNGDDQKTKVGFEQYTLRGDLELYEFLELVGRVGIQTASGTHEDRDFQSVTTLNLEVEVDSAFLLGSELTLNLSRLLLHILNDSNVSVKGRHSVTVEIFDQLEGVPRSGIRAKKATIGEGKTTDVTDLAKDDIKGITYGYLRNDAGVGVVWQPIFGTGDNIVKSWNLRLRGAHTYLRLNLQSNVTDKGEDKLDSKDVEIQDFEDLSWREHGGYVAIDTELTLGPIVLRLGGEGMKIDGTYGWAVGGATSYKF